MREHPMNDLTIALRKSYRERYRKWLETRDAKYLAEQGLSRKEVEDIREEVYREYCKDLRSKA